MRILNDISKVKNPYSHTRFIHLKCFIFRTIKRKCWRVCHPLNTQRNRGNSGWTGPTILYISSVCFTWTYETARLELSVCKHSKRSAFSWKGCDVLRGESKTTGAVRWETRVFKSSVSQLCPLVRNEWILYDHSVSYLPPHTQKST